MPRRSPDSPRPGGLALVAALLLASSLLLPAAARAQSGNPLHDQLSMLEEARRRTELFRAIAATGSACQALIGSYFAGFDRARTAYWDSRCREGTMYRLGLPAQRYTRPTLVVCGALGAGIAGGPCFQPIGAAASAQAAAGTGVRAAGPSAEPPPGSRFGAVYATDAPVAAWGFANGSADRLAVNTSAVRACQTMAGRVPCKFVEELVNRCGALAQAVTRSPYAVVMTSDISTMVLNRNFTATAGSGPAAEQAAMDACRQLPNVTCRIVASGC